LLYLIICIAFAPHEYVGDESRYLYFANNLLKGFYSPPYPEINLWNGPGYPLFLAPFIFLKLPLLALRLLNGLLLYFSLIISYKTFSIYSSKRSSFLYTVVLGLYFPIFEMLPLILTESLTWFLISLICFLFIKIYMQNDISWKLVLLTALSMAFLVMTKLIFGYVILIMLFVSIFIFLFPEFRLSAKKSTLIFLLSFVFCFPWLLYTYSLTNKLFYWTNSGSMTMYTMSTPFANELGDWKSSDELQQNPNHKVFMDSIAKLNSLQEDEAYKAAAIKNIKNHPKKYLSNWVANVGRLLFSYPFSGEQTIKTYWTIIPNMFVIVIIVLTFALSILHYKKFPEGLILLFLFILIYLFGSTLVSAYRRMFYVTMPFWACFISYVFNNIISVKFKYV
jgi:4-amino-4-deoxy-L-arabinose transferase-like glycosyltransferase